MLTVKQVAQRLNCSSATVYALVDSGKLPVVKIGVRGGGMRIQLDDLQDFIESRRTGGLAERVTKVVTLKHLR